MSITLKVNDIDKSSVIAWEGLSVLKNITNIVDVTRFNIRKIGSKTYIPSINDDIKAYDGADLIFGGTVLRMTERAESSVGGLIYAVEAVDYQHKMDNEMVARIYEGQTVEYIINDIITTYAPGFTTNNVTSTFVISKIVFNQVSISSCIKRLAEILNYEWYVDQTKDVHFFDKLANSAPFNIDDSSGNYVPKSLERVIDGSQIVNRVKVRGGEYEGSTYTDVITVSGNDSKSFNLPQKVSNLTIEVDTGAGYVSKNVGIDNIDDFTTDDVLYSYTSASFRFENALADTNKIRWSGNKKIKVFVAAEDLASIALYGKVEKLLRDDSIKDNAVARRRANAELYAFANSVIDLKFKTYNSGLRAGMSIHITNSDRDIDEAFVIKTIEFSAIDPDTFIYNVQLINSRRNDLISLLQKILEPEDQDAEESEVAEDVVNNTEVLNIIEEIEVVTPVVADEDLSIDDDNYIIDPLGAGVEPIWVLGPYTPTGQTDTKRTGRLDISLKVY